MDGSERELRVVIDGAELEAASAREVWALFSAHMEHNRGDFDGFAATRGKRHARTELRDGVPTLVLSDEPGAGRGAPAAKPRSPRRRRGRRGKRKRSKG